jgi:hypothetical protein
VEDEIRAPDTLVETTFYAIADAGSIPAVSTKPRKHWGFKISTGGTLAIGATLVLVLQEADVEVHR